MTGQTKPSNVAYVVSNMTLPYSGVALVRAQILEFSVGDVAGSLETGELGTTILQYRAPWGRGSEVFQGIHMWAGKHFVIEVVVAPSERSITVNRVELSRDLSHQLVLSRASPDGQQKTPWGPVASHVRSDDFPLEERRYLQKIALMEQALGSSDEGVLISAFAALRLMLLEGHVNWMNRDRGLKLEFYAIEHESPPVAGGFAISRLKGSRVLGSGMKAQQFLKMGALTVDGRKMSVGEMIKFVANSLGEHHFDREQSPEMFMHYDQIRLQGAPLMLAVMRDVLEVFLIGVCPLTTAIVHPRNPITA